MLYDDRSVSLTTVRVVRQVALPVVVKGMGEGGRAVGERRGGGGGGGCASKGWRKSEAANLYDGEAFRHQC